MNVRNFLESSPPVQSAQPEISDELSIAPTPAQEPGAPLRHILLGSPDGVRQTIHLLHTLQYAETTLWSPLVPIPSHQLIITPRLGEVMSILVKSGR
ncbi:MAG: hypothetical protein WBB01_03820 [Phormidesmis sp.]